MSAVQPDPRVAMLEEENATLRERIAYLERELLGADLVYPLEWRLTATEQRVVSVLLKHPLVRKEMIMASLYRDTNRDEAEIKIVDVFICKIRKKLAPFAITIRTIWGQGYQIEEPQRTDLKNALHPEASIAQATLARTRLAEGAIAS